MATHHKGAGQLLDRDATSHGNDTEVDYDHEDKGDFELIGQETNTNLANLTWELDDLCYRVQTREGQSAEAQHHIEQELKRLTIALCPLAPPEPIHHVLRQYTDILCSA